MKANNPALQAKIAANSIATSGNVTHNGMLHFLKTKHERDFVKILLQGKNDKSIEYYLQLWRAIKRLDPTTQKVIRRIVGTEIDLQNILWVYRLKKFYQLHGERVYSYLVPVRYRVMASTFAELVACRDVSSFEQILASTVYGNVFENFTSADDNIGQAITRLCRQESKNCPLVLFCLP